MDAVPPGFEVFEAGELAEDFERGDRADAWEAFGVI